MSQMESESLEAQEEEDHCEEKQQIRDRSPEHANPTQMMSASSSAQERDPSGSAVEGDREEAPLEMPLFVQIKEEPNYVSEEDTEEDNFESNGDTEDGFEEKRKHPVEEDDKIVTTKKITGSELQKAYSASKSALKRYLQSSRECRNTSAVEDARPTTTGFEETEESERMDMATWEMCSTQEAEGSTSSQYEKAFPHSFKLSPGKKTQAGEKIHKCYQCDKVFSQACNLNAHMRIHTGEKPFKCTECNKAFVQRNHLNDHMRIHTGEKPFKCNQCDKTFSHSVSLSAHMHVHTGEKPFKCTHCDKAFTQSSTLTAHMRIHAGEKPYKCTQCDKAFSQSGNLTTHMRIHTREKPYKCNQCDKAYSQSGTLTAHMRIHTGEKPYECTQCDKAFSQRKYLTSHMRTHAGGKPYKQCDLKTNM